MPHSFRNHLLCAATVFACLGVCAVVQAQQMESVGQSIQEESVRRVLEANLKITEIKVKELQVKVDAMKACYAQNKIHTPTGCVDIPQQAKSCTCGG